MKNQFKRLIAGFCAASLLFSSLQIPVFAEEKSMLEKEPVATTESVVQQSKTEKQKTDANEKTENSETVTSENKPDAIDQTGSNLLSEQSAQSSQTIDLQTAYSATATALLQKLSDASAVTGAEWLLIGLSRGDFDVSQYSDRYVSEVVAKLEKYTGKLHSSSADQPRTDYSKAIITLAALGERADDLKGFDLTSRISCLEKVTFQGLNGPIWALLALDSLQYDIPNTTEDGTQVSRDNLIQTLLTAQHEDGGWSLNNSTYPTSDIDITAMTLQALAKYYSSNEEVKTACDKALTFLSQSQRDNGNFVSWGSENVESSAQVLVALTALNIDPMQDMRFIKNGKTVIDAILGFYVGEGFEHEKNGGLNAMATEQAFYALTAYYRLAQGKTFLYDMSDIAQKSDIEKATKVSKMIDALPAVDQITLQDEQEVEAAKIAFDLLSANAKKYVDPALVEKLNAVTEKIAALQRQKAEEQKKAEEEKKKKEQQHSQTSSQQTKTASGSTKSIGKIDGETKAAKAVVAVISDLVKSAQSFPENADAITVDQEKAIIDTYKQFDALEPEEKLVVGKDQVFAGFEGVLEKLGKKYHHDQTAKVDFRDNDKDVLPWYVKVYGETKQLSHEQNTQIVKLFGEDAQAVKVLDISLTNVLTEKDWEPENPVTFKIEELNLSDELNTAVLHFNKNGKVDVMEGTKEGKSLTVKTQSFSPFAVISYHGQMSDVMNGDSEAATTPNLTPWLIGGGCLIVLLAVVIFLKIRSKSKE